MKIVSNGKEMKFDGFSSSGGNPIGTIISFMGKTAPNGYLACDGSIYNISDYPSLALLFSEQFETSNYFGGDGLETFAVPDMRNLFLRGFHSDAENISDDLGVKQEGTKFPGIGFNFASNGSSIIHARNGFVSGDNMPVNLDSVTMETGIDYNPNTHGSTTAQIISQFKSRPDNMAVLYCIKAK